MAINENIKRLRLQKGLSQSKLAEMAQASLHTIFRAENNKTSLNVALLKRIAEALGVSVDDLLRGPVEERWVLEIKVADSKEEVIDMTGTMPCVAAITGTQSGANLQLSAKWETFRDDAKFQDFIDQVTRARGLLLEMGAGMEKLKEAGA